MKRNSIVAVLAAVAAFSFTSAVYAADTSSTSGNPAGSTDYGPVLAFRQSLKGRQVQTQNGEQLGKVNNVVVDLESGRVLYALISSGGQGTAHAVPPELFAKSNILPPSKPLILNTDKQKFNGSPTVAQGDTSKWGDMNFANQVYSYFGQQPWWGTSGATGRENQPQGTFGNVQDANSLLRANVNTSANQPLGKVDNVIIDLPNGRVPFLLISGQAAGRTGQQIPIPSMALTRGSSPNQLVTGVDQSKLQSAPQLQQNRLRQLEDPSFAANIYQFYGKQAYWQGTPTSSQPSSRIYPENR